MTWKGRNLEEVPIIDDGLDGRLARKAIEI
jgi:hypothetical protein